MTSESIYLPVPSEPAKDLSHCPWVHNCVGANNHRHFFLYILFMEVAILLFVRLVLACQYNHDSFLVSYGLTEYGNRS